MEYICPLCNGMEDVTVECLYCGNHMINRGTVQEYFDDYSPYLDMEISREIDGVPPDQCLHVFICPLCNKLRRVAINLVEY